MKEILRKIKPRRLMWYAVFLLLTLMLQNTVFTRIRPFGVCPMVLPAAAVAVGMFEGASWGALFGLVLGILADMDYVETTVMFTLLLPAVAFFAGFVSQFFINRRFFAYMGAALVASLVCAVVQMLGTAASDGWAFSMLGTVLLQTLWSLPPAVLVYFPPAKWIE